ncbi:MAG: VIT domain-containing protein [Chloroflexota bacterium]|nr:VIT domain-containing protein [Chloroflexota bacterium]
MKTRMWLPVLFVLLFLSLAHPVSADGIIVPVPPPSQPPPPLRSLAIKYHRVHVTIDNQIATTHVDQVFLNEGPHEIEGQYIFPIPENASISTFAMWVDGHRLEAQVLDKEEARAIYEQIVAQQRDPALLEYVGRNAFRARVYPIPAHGEKRIQLEYQEILSKDSGLVKYVYPLNTEKFSTRPLEDVQVSVEIIAHGTLKAAYSPSHDVTVQREGDRRITVEYKDTQVTPDKDFVLYYTTGTDDLGANVLSYKEPGEEGFFLLFVDPKRKALEDEIVDRDVFFVLDTSGSMRGEKLAQAKRALKYVLRNLHENDRFNIISFATSTRLYAWTPQEIAERDEAYAFVNELEAGGGTNIDQALKETLEQTGGKRFDTLCVDHGAVTQSIKPPVVIFLTDGLATEGETRTKAILEHARASASERVQIFAFGVGYDVNTVLLDRLSQEHNGTSSYVKPGESIERIISSFYDKISSPVLSDVSLELGQVHAEEIFPSPLPDLFAGNQLLVLGRYRQGGRTTVRMKGLVNGRATTYTFRDVYFQKEGGEGFIPRLWATRKIGHLLTQIRLYGAEGELVDEIIRLSLEYGIVTPYTSFLVDETEDTLTADSERPVAPGSLGTATPAAASISSAVSGKAAVESSVAQRTLREAEVVHAPAGERLRTTGNKAFVLQNGTWVDTAYEDTMEITDVPFASDTYFELIRDHPTWGPYLALGDRVLLVWEGRGYRIGPKGNADATSDTVTEPTASPTPIPTLAERVQPTRTPAPTPAPNVSAKGFWPSLGSWLQGILGL